MSFEAGQHITIPSPIDVHVHLRQPGGETKETIASGTYAALIGGYQAVFDMPNNPGGNETWSRSRLEKKIAIAEQDAFTDIGFYAGVNIANPAFNEFSAMVTKAAGLKLYMGHTTGNITEQNLETARPAIDEWIRNARNHGVRPPILLHAREEIGSETADYIARQEYPVHWCHISTETEAASAERLTKRFPEHYTGGVTPHHLTMTERNADFQQGWNGARMQPPLGKEVDADRLLHAYNNGDIQILETDHAPHTYEDKMRAEELNPEGKTDPDCQTCFGVSGIEFVLPIMMAQVQRGNTTVERVVDSLNTQPLRMLGLSGKILRQQTEIVFRPYLLTESDIAGMSSNTPYIGWMGGAVVAGITRDGRTTLPAEYGSRQGESTILHQTAVL